MSYIFYAAILAGGAFFLFASGALGAMKNIDTKAFTLSMAVAFAEGFMDRYGNILKDNIPAKFHNPGDLGPGDAPNWPSESHDGSNVVKFNDDATGWKYLRDKLKRILSGNSSTYSLDDSFEQMGEKYAGDSANWTNNVTAYLGVNREMTLREWLDA